MFFNNIFLNAQGCFGYASSNSSFLSTLQISQMLHISMKAEVTYEPVIL